MFHHHIKCQFRQQRICICVGSCVFCVGSVHRSQGPQVRISVKFSLKLGPTILFTHLKIILLHCFQFQFITINNIQTAPRCRLLSVKNKVFLPFFPLFLYPSSPTLSSNPAYINKSHSHRCHLFIKKMITENDISPLSIFNKKIN